MAVSLLATLFFFVLPVMQYYTVSQDAEYRGLEGIRYQKKQYEKLSVLLTDAYIAEAIEEVGRLFENPDYVGYDGYEQFLIDDAYWENIAAREKLLNMIATNYAEPGVRAGYNSLPFLDSPNREDFYQARQDKIETILDTPSRGLSGPEKEYWLRMNNRVETPFQYGYYEGWEVFISCFGLFVFPLLAICIVLSPVFCGEYQAGTDAVILSARYGKTRLVTAKTAASILFGLLAFTLHMAVAFGITFMAYGAEGWDLPLQLAGTTVPYPLTFLEGTLINLLVIYLVLLAMMGLTLFLSAKMKSAYMVLVVLVPLIFVPFLLSPNGTAGLYNLILFLLPYYSTMPQFASFISYQCGALVLDAFSARIILYMLLAVILFPLAGRGFKKHQVS